MNNLRSCLKLCLLSLILGGSANAQWVQTNNFPGGYIAALVVDSTGGAATNLLAGTSGVGGGVFRSTDNGLSWAAAGLMNSNISALAINGPNLFAGTPAGIWRWPLSEMITSAVPSLAEFPAQFSLMQNYPNPFNPSTTIRYALPARSDVSLTVYNILGQEVATLVNDNQDAGYHQLKFDGSKLGSRVYLYRLTAGDFVEIKRLLLLKNERRTGSLFYSGT